MNARLLMHIREHPTGRVIVTPVDFANLSVDAEDVGTAMRAAVARSRQRLGSMSGSFRARLAEPVDAELDSITVNLARKKGAKPVTVTVALVVALRETQAGPIYVVSAPELPHVRVAARERDDARSTAQKEIKEAFQHWDLDAALSCDDTGSSRLELVEVPFPPPSEGDDTDDGFALESAADDLTALAAAGRLSRLDGRDALVERVLAALGAETRASVMLVGRQDVGKTALVDEVAGRLATDDVPAPLQGRRLWRISANELIAGARFTGMWQDRARVLISRGRAGAIFAMGDPNGILDAGRWSGSDNNLGRVLQTYVENGELSLICECSEELYAAAHVVEPSFIDAFQRIDMPEPPEDDAREIVTLAAQRLEARHGLEVEPEAAATAFDLGRRFEPYRALPGKAVRLLEETIQQVSAGDDPAATVGREDVIAAFAARSGMPRMLLTDEVRMDRTEVRAFLEQRVLGQPDAIEQVVDLVTVFKAGLQDPNKPVATLFFVGPTGVGKTELSKALAEFLFGSRDRVIRFDMGEYGSGDAVAKLLGSGWSHERKGGELTTRVREQPFCVVLLDEIEKAHPDVYDALLSAIGEGRLTDARGSTADFRNAIVIMTSNLGASRRESSVVGFTGDGDAGEEEVRLRRHFAEQAEKFFRPEFFNRIDRLITFDALDRETIRSIARRHLGRLLMREGIARRRLLVEIDDAVVDHLAQIGFHPRYGARPLLRAIEQAVIQPLARVIVSERPEPGALIRFTVADGEVKATLHALEIKRTPPARRERQATPRDASFVRAAADVDRLAERVDADGAEPETVQLADELSGLVELANAPSFWDDPDDARRELARLYRLQQLAERRTAIAHRVEGLAGMAQRVRQSRDRHRLPELREAIAEIEDDLELLRFETIATAHSETEADADVRVTPIGPDAEPWAEALLAMYAAWAERTGRSAGRLDGEPLGLRISGAASLALLRNETGLHRRRLPNGTTLLARVAVGPAGEQPEPPRDEEAATVVRGYSEGRHVFVKDTRTGQKTSDVSAVLERGLIDDFLVAELRHTAARA